MTTKTLEYTVRAEPFENVREEVVSLLNSSRPVSLPAERFDWLYLANPDGEATVWTVRPNNGDEMAGFTVALPRRMFVEGKLLNCWNCADFSIYPKFRSLGIAMKLRRAAKEGVDAGQVDFLYAHPNARMQVIHQQVGHSYVGRMVRFAKVLRSRSYFAERLSSGLLASMAALPVDAAIRIRSRYWRHHCTSAVNVKADVRFDSSFDGLFERAAEQRAIVGVRDARYLNWRYADNPLHKTHAVLAQRRGRLVGYLLFTVRQQIAELNDAFFEDADSIAMDLFAGLERHCRQRRIQRLSLIALEGNPIIETAAHFGFSRRPETSSMFGYAPEGTGVADLMTDPQNWFLTVGDRDQ